MIWISNKYLHLRKGLDLWNLISDFGMIQLKYTGKTRNLKLHICLIDWVQINWANNLLFEKSFQNTSTQVCTLVMLQLQFNIVYTNFLKLTYSIQIECWLEWIMQITTTLTLVAFRSVEILTIYNKIFKNVTKFNMVQLPISSKIRNLWRILYVWSSEICIQKHKTLFFFSNL